MQTINDSQGSDVKPTLTASYLIPSLNRLLQYLSDKLNLTTFTIEELEDDCVDSRSPLLCDVAATFIRYVTKDSSISLTQLHPHLKTLIQDKFPDDISLHDDAQLFPGITPNKKVELIKCLSDVVLNSSEFTDSPDIQHDLESLKPTKVGLDAESNVYWYYGDHRLYKENTCKSDNEQWSVVCSNEKDWDKLIEDLNLSLNSQEQELCLRLKTELFPLIGTTPTNQRQEELEKLQSSLLDEKKQGLLQKEQEDITAMLKGDAPSMLHQTDPVGDTTDSGALTSAMVPPSSNTVDNQLPKLPCDPALCSVQLNDSQKVRPPSTSVIPHSNASFMQQQSKICVFSTGFINRAADAVLQGRYQNIIDFHLHQSDPPCVIQKMPGFNSYEETSSIPLQQMANMRPPYVTSMMKGEQSPCCVSMGSPNPSVAQWVQQQNANLQERTAVMDPRLMAMDNSHMDSRSGRWIRPMSGPQVPMQQMYSSFMDSVNAPNLLQQKVPDENLTPEQLQRREEQLAHLRKIQQMLFPENQTNATGHHLPQMGVPNSSAMFCNTPLADQAMFQSQQGMMPNCPSSMQGDVPSYFNQMPSGPTNMDNVSAKQEWLRLQHEFYMDRQQMQQQYPPASHAVPRPPPPYPNPTFPMNSSPLLSNDIHSNAPPLVTHPGNIDNLPNPHTPANSMVQHQLQMESAVGSMMDPMLNNPMVLSGSMSNINNNNTVTTGASPVERLHKASNPEKFNTDPISLSEGSINGGSQKRKRNDFDELYKNLQLTPSPQQMNYLNQFVGQELTITKHMNSAFSENVSACNSPSVSSADVTPTVSLTQSGSTTRLSHFESNSTQIKNIDENLLKSVNLGNITSASLAHLAKGVEHLSNKMQQSMFKGGPYHSIQVNNQMQGGGVPNSANLDSSPPIVTSAPMTTTPHSTHIPASQKSAPTVNNTYVNATMSIQQLNIQSVHAPNCNPMMQVQQMTNDIANDNIHISVPQQANGPPKGMPSQQNPYQNMTMQQNMSSQFGMPNNPHDSQLSSLPHLQNLPIHGMAHFQKSHELSQKSMPTHQQSILMPHRAQVYRPNVQPGHSLQSDMPDMFLQRSSGQPVTHNVSMGQLPMAASNNFSSSSLGNTSIQIAPKAPNTIQYLPANPPAQQTPYNAQIANSGGVMMPFQGSQQMTIVNQGPRESTPMMMPNMVDLSSAPMMPQDRAHLCSDRELYKQQIEMDFLQPDNIGVDPKIPGIMDSKLLGSKGCPQNGPFSNADSFSGMPHGLNIDGNNGLPQSIRRMASGNMFRNQIGSSIMSLPEPDPMSAMNQMLDGRVENNVMPMGSFNEPEIAAGRNMLTPSFSPVGSSRNMMNIPPQMHMQQSYRASSGHSGMANLRGSQSMSAVHFPGGQAMAAQQQAMMHAGQFDNDMVGGMMPQGYHFHQQQQMFSAIQTRPRQMSPFTNMSASQQQTMMMSANTPFR